LKALKSFGDYKGGVPEGLGIYLPKKLNRRLLFAKIHILGTYPGYIP
jgi:hypothetical protein